MRRAGLTIVLALVLAVTGLVATLTHATNVAPVTQGVSVLAEAESSALYCTGISGAKGPTPGHVLFINTSDASREVTATVSSDTGRSATTTLSVAAHQRATLDPSSLATGNFYGVAVQIDGSGVIAEEVAANNTAVTPCAAAGVSSWYATGFNTLVGSTARLSILNTTATPAVFNIVTYAANGFAAPASFQGLSVPSHAELVVNVGDQIVDTTNVGVGIKVLRGSIDVVGVQASGSTSSFVQGNVAPSTSAAMPAVTTAHGATAQVRVANPGADPANVKVAVSLGQYQIAPQTTRIAPYSTGLITITPNSAIATAGYASLRLSADQPVITTLATGNGSTIALASPEPPSSDLVLADATGLGFDAAILQNTSKSAAKVTIHPLGGGNDLTTTVPAGSVIALKSVANVTNQWRGALYEVRSARVDLVLGLTLITRPTGAVVIEPLDGR